MAFAFLRSSSQTITATSAPVTATPLTMCGLYRPNTASDFGYVVELDYGAGSQRMALLHDNTETQAFVASGGTASASKFVATMSTTDYTQIAGVFLSSTSRTSYRNGAAATTNTTNLTPTNIDTLVISGAKINNTLNAYTNGRNAEIAIWSTNLTADEITSLSKGFKPYRVRPQSLVFYAPLIRNLQDIKGGLALTNNNAAAVADHPRVY